MGWVGVCYYPVSWLEDIRVRVVGIAVHFARTASPHMWTTGYPCSLKIGVKKKAECTQG